MDNMLTTNRTATNPIRVAIVEDDGAAMARFQHAISVATDLDLIAQFGNGASALAWLEHNTTDVLLCDLGLPDFSGLAVIGYCAKKYPNSNVMVITMYEDEDHVIKSLEAGASGYILKDSMNDEIVAQIRELHAGGSPMTPVIARLVLKRFHVAPTAVAVEKQIPAFNVLTEREIDILARISQGFSYLEIAGIEKISQHTVATHIKRIYAKLSVHSKNEAVFEAMQMGLLDGKLQKIVRPS
jgi:DNA-binding NarL/FixJ family response regulator